MMRAFLAGLGAIALLAVNPSLASATSLRVAPTTIDLAAPDSASVITLRNDAKKPINVQLRVFRWSQEGGKEKLVPTNEVVASPPSTKIAPGAEYVARIVRVSKRPVTGEESYRVLVDEVPTKSEQKPGLVNLVVRHSIPVFFGAQDATAPDVSWSVAKVGGSMVLTARNDGASRLKLSDLSVSQSGKAVATRKGLVGYVLGGSTMTFPLGRSKGLTGATAMVKAMGNTGPFDAKATVKGE